MNQGFGPSYLILGNGRLSQHFQKYLGSRQIPFLLWSRRLQKETGSSLKTFFGLRPNAICLLALKDDVLVQYTDVLSKVGFQKIVHFSGSQVIEGSLDFHPLMSFSDSNFSIESFESMSFVGTSSSQSFREVFPFLKNSYFQISAEQKALYHANCVVAGNIPQILWQRCWKDFSEMGLSRQALRPYFLALIESFLKDPEKSLTGPIVRGDLKTIQSNLNALAGDFRADVYQNILTSFSQSKKFPEVRVYDK